MRKPWILGIILAMGLLAGCTNVVDPGVPDEPVVDPLEATIFSVETEYPYVTIIGCIQGGERPYSVAHDCDTASICPPGNPCPCAGEIPCPPEPDDKCCFEVVCTYYDEGDYVFTLTVLDANGEVVVKKLDIAIEKPVYTVEFVDYDGTVIDSQDVKHGEDATAPDDPERDGYVFDGWDTEFTNVTEDLVVTAIYEEIEDGPPGPPNGPPGPPK